MTETISADRTTRAPIPTFTPDEYRARREKIFDAIGPDNLAIVQGAPDISSFARFRQCNELHYLCGIESPAATMLLDGRGRQARLYLPHRDEHRSATEGKVPSAEDAGAVMALCGVDAVLGPEGLAMDLAHLLFRRSEPVVYTPMSPGEAAGGTRDQILAGTAMAASDPWDGAPSREGRFIRLLRERFPQLQLRNLTPILDRLRLVKSPAEIERMRIAGRLCALGTMEAIRSTEPGMLESDLQAIALCVFLLGGAEGEGYRAIVASGSNTMMGHYFKNDSVLKSGDLVLFDYAPDFAYYTSDIGRMFPVSGRFEPWQRQLYDIVLAMHLEVLDRIKPGAMSWELMREAADAIRPLVDRTHFPKPEYEAAARRMLESTNALSHSVGMAVHDAGDYRDEPMEVGQVFSVDPGLAVFEENFSMRVEDTVVVTEHGMENLTALAPLDGDAVEALMRESGVIEPLRRALGANGTGPA